MDEMRISAEIASTAARFMVTLEMKSNFQWFGQDSREADCRCDW